MSYTAIDVINIFFFTDSVLVPEPELLLLLLYPELRVSKPEHFRSKPKHALGGLFLLLRNLVLAPRKRWASGTQIIFERSGQVGTHFLVGYLGLPV
jgi:hypothetical protein